MPTDCISYQKSGYFSKLIVDYLDEKPEIQSLYHRFPTLENFASKKKEKKGNATVNFSNSNINGVGLEPKVVGAAFGVKPNQSSKAIAGNTGVFYIIPSNQQIQKNQKGSMILDNLNRQLQGKFQQTLLQSLIQAADVVDNRDRALR